MSKAKYAEPNLDYRKTVNLWYSYTDTDGSQHVQRLQFLPSTIFLQLCERMCSRCERAAEKLPGLLEQVHIDDSADRWWVLHELVGYGATLDGICATEAACMMAL
jgi:hypothetical protein